jgi:hypothetical protein
MGRKNKRKDAQETDDPGKAPLCHNNTSLWLIFWVIAVNLQNFFRHAKGLFNVATKRFLRGGTFGPGAASDNGPM